MRLRRRILRPQTDKEPAMSAAENKALMKHAFEELAKANSRPYFEMMADDFTFTVMGGTAWARTWTGKESVIRDLHGPLRAQFADTFTIQAVNIVAEGDVVVVEARGCVSTKRGDRYDNKYCLIYEMKDGRTTAVREYADSALAERVLDPPPPVRLPETAAAR
jgi:ketosteroid isomerase-like protein